MKPLIIPLRYRNTRDGKYVRCGVCRKNVTLKCGQSGKRINTCKYTASHRFQSKIIIPGTRSMKVKTWPKEVRDLNEFFQLHEVFKSKVELVEPQKSLMPPSYLSDCLAWFVDWLDDINVPEYAKKNNTVKYVSNQAVNIKDLKFALIENSIDPDTLLIENFNKEYINLVYQYLISKFSNKTVNHKISTYRACWKFLIEEGNYDIKNGWKDVKPKSTKPKTDIITNKEFKQLCEFINPEGGVKFEKKGNGRVGRKNLYRSYLVDGWRLSLYSGGRPEEITHAKLSDVKEHFLVCINYKVSRASKEEKIRMIPLFSELIGLIEELKNKYNLKSDDYLIAHKESNRKLVARILSDAFSHYWQQISTEKRRFYDLRNTYATAAIQLVGKDFSGRIGLHERLATSIEHYQNEQKALQNIYGKSLYG